MASPIVSLFFKLVGFVLILNRILYSMAVYKNTRIERDEDLYLKSSFCNQANHREIGRHTTICLEADRRLASSVAFHTAQHVVNDTLYRELHFHTLMQVTGVIVVVISLGAFHTRYIKNNVPQELPTLNKCLKID
jgi:hypothetical protein